MCVCSQLWEEALKKFCAWIGKVFGHLRLSILWSTREVDDILEQRSCYNLVPMISRDICVFSGRIYSIPGKSDISAFLLKNCSCILVEIIHTVLKIIDLL